MRQENKNLIRYILIFLICFRAYGGGGPDTTEVDAAAAEATEAVEAAAAAEGAAHGHAQGQEVRADVPHAARAAGAPLRRDEQDAARPPRVAPAGGDR